MDVEKLREILIALHIQHSFFKQDGLKELNESIILSKLRVKNGDVVGANARIILGVFSALSCDLAYQEINQILTENGLDGNVDDRYVEQVYPVLDTNRQSINCFHDAELVFRKVVFYSVDYATKVDDVVKNAHKKAQILSDIFGEANQANLSALYDETMRVWRMYLPQYSKAAGEALVGKVFDLEKDESMGKFDKMVLVCGSMDIFLNLFGIGDKNPFLHIMEFAQNISSNENNVVSEVLDLIDKMDSRLGKEDDVVNGESDKIQADTEHVLKDEPPEEKLSDFLTDDALGFLDKLGLNDDQDRDDHNQEGKEE